MNLRNLWGKGFDKARKAFKREWGNAEDNDSYDNFDRKKRLMDFNRFFSNWKVFTVVYIACAIIILLLLVIFLSGMQTSISGILGGEKTTFSHRLYSCRYILLIGFIAAAVGYVRFAYLIRTSYGNINVGQKGTARWTTREEIAEQYRKIPMVNEPFKGMGGIPIARAGDEIYIDDSNTNTLILGGTRSGKDEIYGRPFIDIISRADEKCSLVITDPKLEQAFGMIPKLKERGYKTYILNYIDSEFSDGNNPLDMIIGEYKEGHYDVAQDLCLSLAHYVFVENPNATDPFFDDKARDVFTAFCYAEIEDNIEADRRENARRKAKHDREEKSRKTEYEQALYGDNYEVFCKAKIIKEILSRDPMLADDFLIDDFNAYASARGETITLSRSDDIAALKRFEFKKSEYQPRAFFTTSANEKKITLNSIVKLCVALSQVPFRGEQTYLDLYFLQRDENNFARGMYGNLATSSAATKNSVLAVFNKGVTAFLNDSIAKMTAESTFKIEELAFGKQPVAVFLGIPDYDKSKHFLATVFINQTIFLLSKLSLAMPSGKLPRRVHLWINEFGNLPMFENLENHLTVGLGRNIVWTLLLQSYGQLEKYGDIKETIKDNCGNKIFIMASGGDTVEEVSKALGSETQVITNRTGKKLSISKELTEMTEEVPLMRPEQLQRLETGETIVIRTMYRKNLKGNPIKTHPIKNFGKNRMLMAHTFLSDTFPYDQMLYRASGINQIIVQNPDLANMKFNLVEGHINRRTYVDIMEHTRSGNEFVENLQNRKARFPAYTREYIQHSMEGLTMSDFRKAEFVFDLMGISEAERDVYRHAGLPDDNGDIVNPDRVLHYGEIYDFAYSLIKTKRKSDAERGYKILDIIDPIENNVKSDAEIAYEEDIEAMIASLDYDFDEVG